LDDEVLTSIEGATSASPPAPAARFRHGALRRAARAVEVAAAVHLATAVALTLAFRFVGERWWVIAVALYLPRIAVAVPLVVLLPATALVRSPRALGATVATGLVVLFPLMGFVPPRAALARRTVGRPVRVLSMNANSGQAGPEALLGAVDRYHPDVVLMQEIALHPTNPLLRELRVRYPSVDARGQFIFASRFPVLAIDDAEGFVVDGVRHSTHFVRYETATPLGTWAVYSVHPMSPRSALMRVRGHGLGREILSGRLIEGAPAPTVSENSRLRALEVDGTASSRARRSSSGRSTWGAKAPRTTSAWSRTSASLRSGSAALSRASGSSRP
jgi:hypothetical protein